MRAGKLAGWFLPEWTLPRDYDVIEEVFTRFCAATRLHAATLDSIIWRQMRELGNRFIPTRSTRQRVNTAIVNANIRSRSTLGGSNDRTRRFRRW
jgi:hypothetical protein